MESSKEKSDRYYAYLTCKREMFIKNLTRIGAKLVSLNDGEYDLEEFLKDFLPPADLMKQKITEKVSETQINLSHRTPRQDEDLDSNGIDSQLINALKAEFKIFEKDFQNLLKKTDPEELSTCASSLDRFDEPVVKTKPDKPKPTKTQRELSNESAGIARGSHYVNQVINPGEMSKIFVQKTRTDVLNSKMEKPKFDDDNLETIYIYRSKNC